MDAELQEFWRSRFNQALKTFRPGLPIAKSHKEVQPEFLFIEQVLKVSCIGGVDNDKTSLRPFKINNQQVTHRNQIVPCHHQVVVLDCLLRIYQHYIK